MLGMGLLQLNYLDTSLNVGLLFIFSLILVVTLRLMPSRRAWLSCHLC